MTAIVNGERRDFPGGTTIGALLRELGVERPVGIAIAVNERVVGSARFEEHVVADGDTIEIIRAVSGG